MVPLKASCHWFSYIIPPGYSTSLTATRYDQGTAIATIQQVATMKNGHCLLVMRGKRSGITTSPNRSTVIRTRLWIKSFKETSPKKNLYLAKGLIKDTTNKPGAVQTSQVSRETENCKEQVGHGHVFYQQNYRFSQSWCFVHSNFRELL